MYSPATRLLAVLALLQTHQQMSRAEIARCLEADVLTVRCYITSLQDMGVPVEGERGPYGAYYLMNRYDVPITELDRIACQSSQARQLVTMIGLMGLIAKLTEGIGLCKFSFEDYLLRISILLRDYFCLMGFQTHQMMVGLHN